VTTVKAFGFVTLAIDSLKLFAYGPQSDVLLFIFYIFLLDKKSLYMNYQYLIPMTLECETLGTCMASMEL